MAYETQRFNVIGFSNNPYPEPNQPNSSTPRPVQVPVNILKALLPSSIPATLSAYLNLLDLTMLTILDERYELWSTSLWNLLHSLFLSPLGMTYEDVLHSSEKNQKFVPESLPWRRESAAALWVERQTPERHVQEDRHCKTWRQLQSKRAICKWSITSHFLFFFLFSPQIHKFPSSCFSWFCSTTRLL